MNKNISDYFQKQGSLYLKNISYDLITLESNPENIKVILTDELETKFVNDRTQLEVIFTRVVKHNPKALFELKVSFGALYTFKNEYSDTELCENDFKDMLKQNRNRLFLNIISRTSQLISEITSSHGQYPLVTPPIFLNNNHDNK